MDNCPPRCLCPYWWGRWHAVLILQCGQVRHALTARTRSQLKEWAVFNWNIQPGLGEWSGFSDAHQEALWHDDFCSSLSHADFWTSDPKTISKLWIDIVKTWFSCYYMILPIIRTVAQLLQHDIATWPQKKPQTCCRSKGYQTPPDNFLNQSSFVFVRQGNFINLMLTLFWPGFLNLNNTHLPNHRDAVFLPSPVPYTHQPSWRVELEACRDALCYGDDLFQSERHMGFALPGKENDGHPECE